MSFRARLAVLALAVAGCGDQVPCTSNCPAIEGRYGLAYEEGKETGDCSNPALRPAELTVTRAGAKIYSGIGQAELSGTVYDTFDFTLNGATLPDAGEQVSYSMKGRFIPAPDGGVASLRGTFNADTRNDAGVAGCTLVRPFTGTRQ